MNFHQHKRLTLALLVVVLFTTDMVEGCKNKESQIPGKWTGWIDAGAKTFELKADRTFTEGTAGLALSGKWSYSEPNVTLAIERVSGRPVEEFISGIVGLAAKTIPGGKKPDIAKIKAQIGAITLTLSDDGKKMTMNPPTGSPEGTQPVTLTKQG